MQYRKDPENEKIGLKMILKILVVPKRSRKSLEIELNGFKNPENDPENPSKLNKLDEKSCKKILKILKQSKKCPKMNSLDKRSRKIPEK